MLQKDICHLLKLLEDNTNRNNLFVFWKKEQWQK